LPPGVFEYEYEYEYENEYENEFRTSDVRRPTSDIIKIVP
jgi:hypothetical protein